MYNVDLMKTAVYGVRNNYDLKPDDRHKSFYGKATVTTYKDGSETLYSYNTPIIHRTASGDLLRIWYGWTATTGRHIKAFCGLNKAEFYKLPNIETLAGKLTA